MFLGGNGCVIFPCQAWRELGSEVTLEPRASRRGGLAGGPGAQLGARRGRGRLALSGAKGFGLPEGAALPARVGSMGCNYTAPGREPAAGRERELAGGSGRRGAGCGDPRYFD